MLIKRCCIESCKSSSTRTEDIGVTFHKFPKDDKLRQSWFIVTQKQYSNEIPAYVCSRHFCRNDFQNYQDSKYILKTDSVPSIFSWTMNDQSNVNMETDTSKGEDDLNVSSSSKDSEENIDAIQKFMEQQDKEIQEQKQNQINNPNNTQKNSDTIDHEMNDIHEEQSIAIATSVLDMILSESEVKIEPVKPIKPKHCLSAGGSVALSVGSKVEAKDYGEIWYPAEILEVDCDEMEVLVHYDSKQNKPDEWINVSSSRLRPIGSAPRAPDPAVEETFVTTEPLAAMKEEMSDDIDKTKPSFVVGERCLARWRDNRRFLATIFNDLGNGTFEIVFDDGFQWKCPNSRLYKLKDSGKATDNLTVDTSVHPTTSTLSPILPGIGPSSGVAPGTNYPNPFHTHLFDPTRDYLGSKTERREMKRKLNIKEIFNIGIKKRKKPMSPKEKSVRVVRERKRKGGWRRKIKQEGAAVKTELPDAVASIIGTVERIENELANPNSIKQEKQLEKAEKGDKLEAAQIKSLKDDSEVIEGEEKVESTPESDISDIQSTDNNTTQEPASEEEVKLEKFEKPDENKHEEVIDKIKEVINKLEGGLNKVEKIESPKPEVKEEQEEVVQETVIEELPPETANEVKTDTKLEKPKKKLSKLNKSKKLRLLQEKKVKKQVEKVKSELEEMKRQFEEMRQQMLKKTEELAAQPKNQEMPESFLLPGEWCCKWVNGQPVGTVSELESEPKFDANNKLVLPRRSVQVEDKRLPEGWTKHMVRRSLGQSAGKWDVVLVGPDNRRFHTKTDMRNFLETNTDESLKAYEGPLLDFGVHLKLARRMGWFKSTGEDTPPPTGVVNSMSPLVKRKKHNNRKAERKEKKKRLKLSSMSFIDDVTDPIETLFDSTESANDVTFDNSVLEDGCVYVGSLKVQIIENLLRCPAEGCLKNFRNNTLLKMHIKHYHRELRKMLGTTPKVEDLAYARAKPTGREMKKIRKSPMSKVIKVKFPRLHRRHEDLKPKLEVQETISGVFPIDPVRPKPERLIPRSQDSPKLRQVLAANKTGKRPKVLLPVRRPEDPIEKEEVAEDFGDFEDEEIETTDIPVNLDFETAITTHTVTKPFEEAKIKGERKKSIKQLSEDDEWYGVNSDFDTRSSCPGSATPECDDRVPAGQPAVNTSEHQKDGPTYTYTESGERVKIVHMKREEIINCHCGYREEDGLMVQCELCLCWQHALCHNIQKEAEVPEKYTCSICLNPKRGRRSKRFLHDQDRLYEGLLPGAKPCELLRRSHELSGNLLRIQDALHALRVKYYVATKKNHPKLYLWAKDWENAEISMTQEKLNSDYSDLNIIINNIGKENLPVKPDDMKDLHMDMRPLAGEELSSLGSPGGTSLDLPISSTELERFTKSVHEQENPRSGVTGPQPEAAIEGGACRERLLRHLQRCQALVDARLDSIEAQVAELESQDPSFADDETADYFPRTKQTIQMLMRDLDTMEELGIVT